MIGPIEYLQGSRSRDGLTNRLENQHMYQSPSVLEGTRIRRFGLWESCFAEERLAGETSAEPWDPTNDPPFGTRGFSPQCGLWISKIWRDAGHCVRSKGRFDKCACRLIERSACVAHTQYRFARRPFPSFIRIARSGASQSIRCHPSARSQQAAGA